MAQEITKEYRELIYKLIERRKQLGMTQKDLSAKANLSYSVVNKIESFDVMPKLDTICRICNVLQLYVVLDREQKMFDAC